MSAERTVSATDRQLLDSLDKLGFRAVQRETAAKVLTAMGFEANAQSVEWTLDLLSRRCRLLELRDLAAEREP